MDDIYKKIEETWHSRARTRHLKGEKLLEDQAEFFAGAMAAMIAIGVPDGQAMPPKWVIATIQGATI